MSKRTETTVVAVYWPEEGDYGQGTVCKSEEQIERECIESWRLGYGRGGKNSGIIHIVKTVREVREWKGEPVKITVNGKAHETIAHALSYEDVLELAGERMGASMTYRGPRHGDAQRSGILYKGKTVTIEDGMAFDCVMTGNS